LYEVRNNAAALVSSYDEAKSEYYREFDANVSRLSESAEELRNFDFKAVTEEPKTPEKVFSAASKVIEAVTENADKETAQTASSDTPKQEVTSPTAAAAKVIEAAAKTGSNSDGSTTTIGTDGSKVTSYGNGAITVTESPDKRGTLKVETEYSKMMQSAFKTVNEFVENYNGTMEFFKSNNAVSPINGKIGEVFADTKYRASSYESIGINVGNDGTLSVDQERLAQAIVENPDRVAETIGKTGLSDKAQSHVDFANSVRSQAFPGAQAMFGDQLSSASFYTSGAYLNLNSFSTVGNLVNMMF